MNDENERKPRTRVHARTVWPIFQTVKHWSQGYVDAASREDPKKAIVCLLERWRASIREVPKGVYQTLSWS
jgi:hypothetical protein